MSRGAQDSSTPYVPLRIVTCLESVLLLFQELLLMFAFGFTTRALNNDLDISLQPAYSCLCPLSHLCRSWVLDLTHFSTH